MKYLILPLLSVLLLCGCNERTKRELAYSGEAQGTYFNVKWFGGVIPASEIEVLIDSIFLHADNTFSTYKKTSLVSEFNSESDSIKMNADFKELILLSKHISEITNGNFDPTIGPLVELYGFGIDERRMDFTQEQLSEVKTLIGWDKVIIEGNTLRKAKKGIKLDFNAIAQGYTADLIGRCLDSLKIPSYLIEVGGELIAKGEKPNNQKWVVGIEKPLDDNENRTLMFSLKVLNLAVATSGNYRKYYLKDGKKIGHTINPLNGQAISDALLSATVIAPDCASADGIATAFMVMGVAKSIEFLEKYPSYSGLLIYEDEGGELAYFVSEEIRPLIDKLN